MKKEGRVTGQEIAMPSARNDNGGKKGVISVGEGIGYGLGAFACQFVYVTVGLYLLYFFTDVAMISAAVAGILIFSTRFWDAIIDPLIGFMSDRTNSRWGQKRPYMLFGAIPLAIAFALCLIVPGFPPGGTLAYYVIMLIVMWTLYSLVTVPYNAILPNMTLDAQERSKVAGYYQVFVLIAIIVIGAFAKPFVGMFPDPKTGWQMLGIAFGVILAIAFLVSFFTIKERYKSPPSERYKAGQIARLLWANKPFMILCLVALFCFISFTMVANMLNYFFKYNLGNEGMFSVAMGCVFVVAGGSVPLWIWLGKRIGKRNVYLAGVAIYAVSMALVYFLQTTDLIAIIPLFVVAGLGFGGMNMSIWSLIPDTVEYSQWKLGARTEGIQYGVYQFVSKLGSSVAGLIAGWGLTLGGYAANAAQSGESLASIRILTAVIPAVCLVAGIICLLFYPITEKSHAMMVAEIEAGRKA